MKKFLLLFITIFFCSISLYAKDLDINKNFRGIVFSPKNKQKVKLMTIDIPSICSRKDTLHMKNNYPLTIFKADCSNSDSCFSLLIIVSVIPDKVKSYNELISETKKEYFKGEPVIVKEWIDKDKSKKQKKQILFGHSQTMGNVAAGFYYDEINKETYNVQTMLIFNKPFAEDDWKAILLNTFLIYNSISFEELKLNSL